MRRNPQPVPNLPLWDQGAPPAAARTPEAGGFGHQGRRSGPRHCARPPAVLGRCPAGRPAPGPGSAGHRQRARITRPIRSTPMPTGHGPPSPAWGVSVPSQVPGIVLRRPAGIKAATASLRDGLRPALTPSTRRRGGPGVRRRGASRSSQAGQRRAISVPLRPVNHGQTRAPVTRPAAGRGPWPVVRRSLPNWLRGFDSRRPLHADPAVLLIVAAR